MRLVSTRTHLNFRPTLRIKTFSSGGVLAILRRMTTTRQVVASGPIFSPSQRGTRRTAAKTAKMVILRVRAVVLDQRLVSRELYTKMAINGLPFLRLPGAPQV